MSGGRYEVERAKRSVSTALLNRLRTRNAPTTKSGELVRTVRTPLPPAGSTVTVSVNEATYASGSSSTSPRQTFARRSTPPVTSSASNRIQMLSPVACANATVAELVTTPATVLPTTMFAPSLNTAK
jgi:hypothetical protein